MKKRFKCKLLHVVLVFVFAMNFCVGNVIAVEREVNALPIPTDHGNKFYETQNRSNEVYNHLLQSFSEQSEVTENQIMELDIKKCYPDYYGGAYINNETGKLMVLLTDARVANKVEVRNATNNSTNVLFETCEVSLNEMYEVIEILSDKIDDLYELGIEIDSISDDILNQRVVVSIKDCSTEKMGVINNLIECDFLYFENSKGIEEHSASLGGGYRVSASGAFSTLGFAATRNGVKGYVVTGHHAGSSTGKVFSYNGTTIGSVTATAYYNNSTADAAFVKSNGNFTPSQVLSNAGSIWGASSSSLAVNTTVYMLGMVSSLQGGQITSINVTTTSDGDSITIKNQCSANYSSQSGDSGAPILLYDGNFGGSKYTLVGIHKGRNATQNLSVFTRYSNICSELGVSAIKG